MTKIIVLAVVAILIVAGAGLVLSPSYVLIEKAFSNKGGSSEYESNTSINDFGYSNIANKAKSFYPDSEIYVYEKVELNDPEKDCMQGPCLELTKTIGVEWTKSAVDGSEDTKVYGWVDEDNTWKTDPCVPSTGYMIENLEINKLKIPSFPPKPPCPWCW